VGAAFVIAVESMVLEALSQANSDSTTSSRTSSFFRFFALLLVFLLLLVLRHVLHGYVHVFHHSQVGWFAIVHDKVTSVQHVPIGKTLVLIFVIRRSFSIRISHSIALFVVAIVGMVVRLDAHDWGFLFGNKNLVGILARLLLCCWVFGGPIVVVVAVAQSPPSKIDKVFFKQMVTMI
jgi:hypothetical protein